MQELCGRIRDDMCLKKMTNINITDVSISDLKDELIKRANDDEEEFVDESEVNW